MTAPRPSLLELRAEVDAVNRELARLLARRMALVDAIGAIKTEAGAALRDGDREAAQIEAACDAAPELTRAEVRAVFEAIFAVALRRMAGR